MTPPERPARAILEAPPRPTRLRKALRFAERSLAVFGLICLVGLPCFDIMEVYTDSMAPTLVGVDDSRDVILTERLSLWLDGADRYDILAIDVKGELEHSVILKRVAALPGETLSFEDGQVCIDGRAIPAAAGLEEVRYFGAGETRKGRSLRVEGGVFVLGDNTRESWDSRFFGAVRSSQVRGRACAIIWPPSRWRLL